LLFQGDLVAQRTFVYVDGFNLYYRALKGSPYKWLNLEAFAAGVLGPHYEILHINYYTARVSGRQNPDAPRRQHAYLRALGTLPRVKVHFGQFLAKTKRRPLVNPPPSGPHIVEVHDMEEKGSDVNLAVHMVHDGWAGKYDAAAIVTNDTDLVEPMRIVKEELGCEVVLICPASRGPAQGLERAANHVRNLWRSRGSGFRYPMASYQLPISVPGTTIVKPSSW
jgi:uncharacterized LabA/DUF88 family protein